MIEYDGHRPEMARMLAARRAGDRIAFAQPWLARLTAASTVLDVGCGPGTLTRGVADDLTPRARLIALDPDPLALAAARDALGPDATLVRAGFDALPVGDRRADVVLAHAVLEHLRDPVGALREARRVLRHRGAVAVSCSDWSHATLEAPADLAADVEAALAGHRWLRRRAGGDPDRGAHLAALVREAGLDVVHHGSVHRVDMPGAELARWVADRLADAAVPQLEPARRATRRWLADPRPVVVTQHWCEVVGVRQG